MGKILKDEAIHRREVMVSFSAHELREILVREAMRVAGADAAADTIKLSVTQEEEGSPGYRVDRWRAAVSLTFKL